MVLDTVGVVLDMEPCAVPMYYSFTMTDADSGISYSTEFDVGVEEAIPVPGVSVVVPGLGTAGVYMDTLINGNIDSLTIDIGIDACATLFYDLTCASTVDPTDFPIWLLESTFNFGSVC